MGYGIRRVRYGITGPGSGITSHGIRDQKGGIWDHSLGIRDHKSWDQGSEGWNLGSQPRDQGSQAMESGIRRVESGITAPRSGITNHGIRDQKGGIWDHSPEIRHYKPWNRDQHFLRDRGSGCTVFVGSGTKLLCHKSEKSEIWYKNGRSDEKTCPVTTLIIREVLNGTLFLVPRVSPKWKFHCVRPFTVTARLCFQTIQV